jgi:hypothetical protein
MDQPEINRQVAKNAKEKTKGKREKRRLAVEIG